VIKSTLSIFASLAVGLYVAIHHFAAYPQVHLLDLHPQLVLPCFALLGAAIVLPFEWPIMITVLAIAAHVAALAVITLFSLELLALVFYPSPHHRPGRWLGA
jgi:hypothetical protein